MTPALLPPAAGEGEEPLLLHCILDAARDPSIYGRLRAAGADASVLPLYEGAAASELAGVAPYLLELDEGGGLLEWLSRDGWGRRWGVFLWSAAPAAALRAHFRRLTRVRTEDGQVLLFRFYDPAVLARILPTCTGPQLAEVFGPVHAFLIEGRGGGVERFSLADGALRREPAALREQAA